MDAFVKKYWDIGLAVLLFSILAIVWSDVRLAVLAFCAMLTGRYIGQRLLAAKK